MARFLTFIGIIVTLLYSVFTYWLISPQLGKLRVLPLNELGDFLAGVFGPLAIFWLILGFLQQGKELKQSTEALQLQAEELNNSVLQQKGLVTVTKQQIEEIRKTSIKPNVEIYLQPNIASMQHLDIYIENTGAGSAKNISFTFFGRNCTELSANEKEVITKFKTLKMLESGIASLASKNIRKSYIFAFSDYANNLGESVFDINFEIKIDYSDTEGNIYTSTSVIDIGEYDGTVELGGDSPYKLYKEVEKIRRILEGFKSGSSSQRLNVDIYTSKNRDDYNKKIEERLGLYDKKNEIPLLKE